MRRRLGLKAFGCTLAAAGTMLALAGHAAAASNVVISQVYGGGGNTGAPYQNDFVELLNRSTSPISVTGWSVQYASATGTGNFAANPVTTLSGVLAAGQYYLVKEAGGAAGNALPLADASGTVNMSGTGGKVILANTSAGLACNGGSTPCSGAQLAQIVDLVGYDGASFFEGLSAAPSLSNTTSAQRNGAGCVDTDNNGADFTAAGPIPRNTVSTFHVCPADNAPSVSSTSPANGAAGVAAGANVSITFSEPVDVTGAWYSIVCDSSGSHTASVSGGPTAFTLDPDGDFVEGETCTVTVVAADVNDQDTVDPPDTMAADYVFGFATQVPATPIHTIQGAAHISPYAGQSVRTTGIVTAKTTNGFWMQDPSPDADEATSEGIFVFTSSAPSVSVGDSVSVSARVQEFRPGGASNGNLTTTELASPTVLLVSTGNALPAPVVIGTGGRIPPDTVIEDDASSGNVETSGVFDPTQDGLDFYESLEGMRVQLNGAVAVGPTNTAFGETPVVGDDGANASVRTYRGGVLLRPNDGNPERVTLDDQLTSLPSLNVGDHYSGPVVGVMDYNFGNPFLEVTSPGLTRVADGVRREVTDPVAPGQLAVATFNFENLAPDNPQSKFDGLASLIVNNLRSPDLIAGEEVQDNSGATDNGVVDASQTLTKLVDAIVAAGGPTYAWREIDPVNDADGGQPGGNIRQVFLFRTDRGLSFVDRPGGDSTTPNAVDGTGASTHLLYSPGRIAPADSAWSASRKPLAGEFDFRGHKLFVIANHFNSKGGDDPLRGRFQPPNEVTAAQRHQQATLVASFVSQLSGADPGANVVVLGDLNDFEFTPTVQILEAAGLHDLMSTLPLNQRYSYDFEGNSEVLDHVLVSGPLFSRPLVFDPVHVNAEFFDQASDHDPSVVRVLLNDPPTASAGGPYTVDEGSSVTLSASGSDPEGDALSYAWDLDGNGSFETPGQSVGFAPDDGPAGVTVKVRATDGAGLSTVAQATVDVANVAPTVSSVAVDPATTLVGSPVTFTGSATDPSATDTTTGFTWAYDTGAGLGAFGANPFSLSFPSCGTFSAKVEAKDKDGGVSAPFTSPTVHVYDGSFRNPLSASAVNLVQRGQVVPVKVAVGCIGFLGGLSPAIALRAGDYDPNVDPGDPTYVVPASVSNADTSGVMREVTADQLYLYNLAVPSTATAGALYTVLIRPFGGDSPALHVLLKIRK